MASVAAQKPAPPDPPLPDRILSAQGGPPPVPPPPASVTLSNNQSAQGGRPSLLDRSASSPGMKTREPAVMSAQHNAAPSSMESEALAIAASIEAELNLWSTLEEKIEFYFQIIAEDEDEEIGAFDQGQVVAVLNRAARELVPGNALFASR